MKLKIKKLKNLTNYKKNKKIFFIKKTKLFIKFKLKNKKTNLFNKYIIQ